MLSPVTLGVEVRLDYATQPGAVLLLNLLPARTHQQQLVAETLRVHGGDVANAFTEPSTATRFVQVVADGSSVHVELDAHLRLLQVDLGHRIARRESQAVPLGSTEAVHYLMPSRCCDSDRLSALCGREFAGIASGYERARAIQEWVREQVALTEVSDDRLRSVLPAIDTATATLARRRGGMRDIAHLMIALCRASGLPARYVSTIPIGVRAAQVELHAWVEVLIDDAWLCFEPTRTCPRTALVRIGTGRDGAEVPLMVTGGGAVVARHAESIVHSLGTDERTLRERDRETGGICTATLGSLGDATRWHQEARQAAQIATRHSPGAVTVSPSRGADVLLFPTGNPRPDREVAAPGFEPI